MLEKEGGRRRGVLMQLLMSGRWTDRERARDRASVRASTAPLLMGVRARVRLLGKQGLGLEFRPGAHVCVCVCVGGGRGHVYRG